MEEKKFQKKHSSFRTVSGSLHSIRSFLWNRTNNSYSKDAILNNSRGFTLIEVITALGVLAILATMAFTVLNPIEQFRKAQDGKRKSDLAQIQRALESYYQDFGRYPAYTGCCGVSNVGQFPYTINEIDGEGDNALHWGSTWAPYIDLLPLDPNSGKFYIYWSDESNNFQTYRIYASLDRGGNDPDACNEGLACANLPGGISGCGLDDEVCNYGVTSPNVSP